MTVSQLPPSSSIKPRSSFPHYIAASVKLSTFPSSVITLSSIHDVIPLPACGKKDFGYWMISPVLTGINVALFGELDKVMAVSEQRFSSIVSDGGNYVVEVAGVKNEDVHLWSYDVTSSTVRKSVCHFDNTETKKFVVSKGGHIKC